MKRTILIIILSLLAPLASGQVLVNTATGEGVDTLQIESVEVTATQRGQVSPLGGSQRMENITFTGLTKLACCTLAESFENSATISTGYSDAISGARQIRLLGLAGIYSAIMDETRPIMRGIGAYYGLSYIPGMWLKSIQISKGVSSVQGGHEAIAGEINLEFRKPTEELAPLFLNAYLDQDLRSELNAYAAARVSKSASTIVLVHGSLNPMEVDDNNDGYLDTPTGREFSVANRWLFTLGNAQIRAGIRYENDRRHSGMTNSNPNPDFFSADIRNENLNAYIKAGIPVGRTGQSSIAAIADYDLWTNSNVYSSGWNFRAAQHSASISVRYNGYLGDGQRLTIGASARTDRYGRGTTLKWVNDEHEGGFLAEYNFSRDTLITVTAGARADYSSLHGWFATPRAHVRLPLLPNLVLRASAGLGYRTANPIADNFWVLSQNRPIEMDAALVNGIRERSGSFGGSLQWRFKLGRDDAASLSVDAYHTVFYSQLIADRERPFAIDFYLSPRPPRTTTLQADFSWTPFTGFDVLLAFRWNSSKIAIRTSSNGDYEWVDRPLTDKYKGVLNLSYATRFRRWVFDFTAQLNGPSRIPTLDHNTWSPAYPLFFAQVSHKISARTVLYIGIENIANYTQPHPIIDGDRPFSDDFNASLIWGPLMGRKVYAGIRINF